MATESSLHGTSFANVLRSFQTGGVTYSDFLAHVSGQLAEGASAFELARILRRRELIEPLPDVVHEALMRLFDSAPVVPESDAAFESETAFEPEPEAEAVPQSESYPAPDAAPAADPDAAGEVELVPVSALELGPAPAMELARDQQQEHALALERERARAQQATRAVESDVGTPMEEGVTVEEAADAWPANAWQVDARQQPAFSFQDITTPLSIRVDSPVGLARRRASRRWLLWLGAAVVLAAGGWFYFHPAWERTVAVVEPVAPATAPAAAASAAQTVVTRAGAALHDCAGCPHLTVLAPGRFKQGSAFDDARAMPAERPQRVVLIRNPFAISTDEVTVEEFGAFVAATRREMPGCDVYDGGWRRQPTANWQEPGFAQRADHPVTCVSWNDAVAYVQWLSTKTGLRYRLPSSSEWEYAVRAGGDAAQPWNTAGTDACEHANLADRSASRRFPGWKVFPCKDGYVNTAPVGSFKANAFGLHDLLGNVFEWTEDCWHEDYVKAPIDGSARLDGDCSQHEARGGSWFSSPAYVRDAYRNHFAADERTTRVGIRVVRDLVP